MAWPLFPIPSDTPATALSAFHSLTHSTLGDKEEAGGQQSARELHVWDINPPSPSVSGVLASSPRKSQTLLTAVSLVTLVVATWTMLSHC